MKGRGKSEIPEKTRLSAASSGMIPTRENPGATPLGIKPGSPKREVSSLTTTPLRPQHLNIHTVINISDQEILRGAVNSGVRRREKALRGECRLDRQLENGYTGNRVTHSSHLTMYIAYQSGRVSRYCGLAVNGTTGCKCAMERGGGMRAHTLRANERGIPGERRREILGNRIPPFGRYSGLKQTKPLEMRGSQRGSHRSLMTTFAYGDLRTRTNTDFIDVILQGNPLNVSRGRGRVVVRLLTSHPGEQGSISGGIAPEFSHVVIVPDDSSGRRGFLGDLPLPPLLHSGAAPYSPRFPHRRLSRPRSQFTVNSLHLRVNAHLLEASHQAFRQPVSLASGVTRGPAGGCGGDATVQITTVPGVQASGSPQAGHQHAPPECLLCFGAVVGCTVTGTGATTIQLGPPQLVFYENGHTNGCGFVSPVGAALVERLACSPLTTTKRVQYPGGSLSDFRMFGIVPDNATGWWVFSEIFRFCSPCIPGLLHSHFDTPSSPLKSSMFSTSETDKRGNHESVCTRADIDRDGTAATSELTHISQALVGRICGAARTLSARVHACTGLRTVGSARSFLHAVRVPGVCLECAWSVPVGVPVGVPGVCLWVCLECACGCAWSVPEGVPGVCLWVCLECACGRAWSVPGVEACECAVFTTQVVENKLFGRLFWSSQHVRGTYRSCEAP
ncbi:hypothetical protein PR048_019431 [Dryococelus australis]|uniref:Uncharacterized protein n=1 Tax=Dryococelus australis TaxID=614101 RepID=A0ABQ9H3J1_9NEOP|nr:hypothetical protein PR048_019431 [Dryococelus australis]